ncbi:MAG: response regulator [Candidatus Hodarchaeales archaeon]
MNSPISIIVAESSEFFALNIKKILDDFILDMKFQWVSNKETFDDYLTNSIDLLVMDLNFLGDDVLTSISILKQKYPHLMIIITSEVNDIRTAFHCLDVGVDNYVCKDERFTADFMVSLHNIIDKIKLTREVTELKNRIFDSENYPTVLFQISDAGVEVVTYDFEEFPETIDRPLNEFLQNIALSFMLVIGQGHNYHEGCFSFPAGDSKFYSSLLFTFTLPNPTARDERLKEGYYQICFFVPQSFFTMFPALAKLSPFIAYIKELVKDSTELADKLGEIKLMLLDKIKNYETTDYITK